MVKRAFTVPRSNCFLIEKPKCKPGVKEIKTLADLNNPELRETDVLSRFRLVTDLSKVNLCIDEMNFAQPSSREVLNYFSKKKQVFFLQ